MKTVISVTHPDGTFYLYAGRNTHQETFAERDPFLWVLPGEPDGSLLFVKPEEDDLEPPTLRSPISAFTICDND
jgi:hypothetical protein